MSILQKAIETVIRSLPDRFDDPLINQPTEVGKARSRVDGGVKVRGEAHFAAEVPYPNLTYGALVYSSIASGKISRLDTAEAERAPGIVFLMTHLNAPRLKAPPTMDEGGTAASNLPVMQSADIYWNGQPIALVIAETQEQADYAASLVQVSYEAQPHVTEFQRAKETHGRQATSWVSLRMYTSAMLRQRCVLQNLASIASTAHRVIAMLPLSFTH